jgi:sugar phosphate isomerase/epimerase
LIQVAALLAHRDAMLGYCTNVHPGTTVDQIIGRLETVCLEVRRALSPRIPFGIGLWLSDTAVQAFRQQDPLSRLVEVCRRHQLRIFSWNAFPFSDFHQVRVKEKVYQPNWSESARVQYTLDLLEVIGEVAEAGEEVSISTLPIAHQSDTLSEAQIQSVVENLATFVQAALELEKTRKIRVHLNLEPEPFCYLEKSQDVVMFFRDYLLPRGVVRLQTLYPCETVIQLEHLILDKIRVCYDTCHAAVLFEDPSDILERYAAVGIQIGKVQISSALVFKPDLASPFGSHAVHRLLEQLAQDRYCHQVHSPDPQTKFADLPEALQHWRKPPDLLSELESEYRIHYHVPIFLEEFAGLGTTQEHILRLLAIARERHVTNHWEVETYTWPAIQGLVKNFDLAEGIVRELNWFADQAGNKI